MAAIQGRLAGVVTITAIGIGGSSVACTYNAVRQLIFDYFDGTVCIVDTTGTFYFGLSEMTTVTYTINGITSTVAIS